MLDLRQLYRQCGQAATVLRISWRMIETVHDSVGKICNFSHAVLSELKLRVAHVTEGVRGLRLRTAEVTARANKCDEDCLRLGKRTRAAHQQLAELQRRTERALAQWTREESDARGWLGRARDKRAQAERAHSEAQWGLETAQADYAHLAEQLAQVRTELGALREAARGRSNDPTSARAARRDLPRLDESARTLEANLEAAGRDVQARTQDRDQKAHELKQATALAAAWERHDARCLVELRRVEQVRDLCAATLDEYARAAHFADEARRHGALARQCLAAAQHALQQCDDYLATARARHARASDSVVKVQMDQLGSSKTVAYVAREALYLETNLARSARDLERLL